MRQVDITIEKLANGGAGCGRYQGKVFFVPFTAPGDLVSVTIVREKSSYAEAELVQLITASPQRLTPICPIFSLCGGCNWQHIDYPSQVTAKKQIFAELLWRAARVSPEIITEVLPAPDPLGYRSRIQLKVSHHGGRADLGFYRPKSHQIAAVPDHCAIAHMRLNAIFEDLRHLLATCPYSDGVNQIDIARGDDDCTSAVLHCTRTSVGEMIKYLLSHQEDYPLINSLFVRHGNSTRKVFGSEQLSYKVRNKAPGSQLEHTLFFSVDAFSQINYRQNQQLIDLVSGFAALTGREKVLDLYCGNGNFSIPLADSAAEVVGFEGNAPSISDARSNAAYNGLSNTRYHCSDSLEAVKKLTTSGEVFDVVILDPPRNGAVDVVRHIPALRPDRIIYVSCDPATLARDLNELKLKGYEVQTCQGVDMFPQTYHLESVTLLTKS